MRQRQCRWVVTVEIEGSWDMREAVCAKFYAEGDARIFLRTATDNGATRVLYRLRHGTSVTEFPTRGNRERRRAEAAALAT